MNVLLGLIVIVLIWLAFEVYKISAFLEGKQRDVNQVDFQKTITTPLREKLHLPHVAASKTVVNGREIKNMDELVDMSDIPWEDAYKAVVDASEGK